MMEDDLVELYAGESDEVFCYEQDGVSYYLNSRFTGMYNLDRVIHRDYSNTKQTYSKREGWSRYQYLLVDTDEFNLTLEEARLIITLDLL